MLRKFTRDTQVSSSKVSAAVTQVTDAINSATQLAQNIQHEANESKMLALSLTAATENLTQHINQVRDATKTITELAAGIHQDGLQTKQAAEQGCTAAARVAQAMDAICTSSADMDVSSYD